MLESYLKVFCATLSANETRQAVSSKCMTVSTICCKTILGNILSEKSLNTQVF